MFRTKHHAAFDEADAPDGHPYKQIFEKREFEYFAMPIAAFFNSCLNAFKEGDVQRVYKDPPLMLNLLHNCANREDFKTLTDTTEMRSMVRELCSQMRRVDIYASRFATGKYDWQEMQHNEDGAKYTLSFKRASVIFFVSGWLQYTMPWNHRLFYQNMFGADYPQSE
jgi:hypothetical protein